MEVIRKVEADVLALLAMAKGPSTDVALAARRYESQEWQLFAQRHDGTVVAVVGVERDVNGTAIVRAIAVLPALRRHGIARQLLDELAEDPLITALEAETNREAVGFYEACGFSVTSLGEKYPGIERFRCHRTVL